MRRMLFVIALAALAATSIPAFAAGRLPATARQNTILTACHAQSWASAGFFDCMAMTAPN